MNKRRLEALLKKYIDKTCTQVEYSELLHMIHNSDNTILESLLDGVYERAPELKLADRSAARILQSILQKSKSQRTIFRWPALGAIAASLLLLITISIIKFKPTTSQTFVRSLVARTKNDHQLIRLPDGSTVVLNKNSYVVYPRNFKGNLRQVTLVGEGYFDIKHNKEKPFVVQVGKLSVAVLGTAFNINSSHQNIAVTVTRGKVSVSDQHKTLGTILPNQQISYNTATQHSKKITVNAFPIIKWQANDLYFDDITLQQVAVILSERFNKPVIIANEQLMACKMTGAFTHGESLQEILKIVCEFNNTTYKEKDNRILINGEGCQQLKNK